MNDDKFQERNNQLLTNISQLQEQEKQLYIKLEDVSLTSEQKQQIINKINEISQIRITLYTSLKDLSQYYKDNIEQTNTVLGQSLKAIDIVEEQLNASKKQLRLLKDDKYNKLRLVEINTYYGKRYDAHAKFMKTIVYICIPILILTIMYNNSILPPRLYSFLIGIIFIIGSVIIGLQIIDMSNRDSMNWDEYDWYFDQSKAPTMVSSNTTTSKTQSNPWSIPSVVCIGSSCCYEGSNYDPLKNMCVPTSI